MGEIADDMIDGTCCCLCGCYFQDDEGGIYTHEHPAVCWECWNDLTDKEKSNYTKSDVDTF